MRANVPVVLLAGLLVLESTSASQGEVVWEIGHVDRSPQDLAFDTDLLAFQKHFPTDVKFVVGRSDPKKDFSAIQPGTLDEFGVWREHPFDIAFDLGEEPAGAYELRLDFLDAANERPPALLIRVNDERAETSLEPGIGELSLLRPEKGKAQTRRFVFPADRLHKGTNHVELRTITGSFCLYDAVSLRRIPDGERPTVDLAAAETIFFVRQDGALKQELSVRATGVLGNEPPAVEVYADDRSIARATLGKPVLGVCRGEVHVEPVDRERRLSVRLSAAGQSAAVTVTQTPQRKWQIYVAPSVHVDVGYTHLQEQVVELHNRNTDVALALAAQFPAYHFNLECAWPAQIWLQRREESNHEALYRAMRDNRIGLSAIYTTLLSGLCTDEELVRDLYYSARMHREHGAPFEWAMITDVPSQVWTLPSILAGAGVRYLSVGVNITRAPLLRYGIHDKNPFWWEGPDGQRVLTWFAAGYGMRQVRRIGIRSDVERMRTAIESELTWWRQRKDYPYDAIYFHGAYGDNLPIARSLAENVTEYAKRYEFPKVILCSPERFFQYVERNYADRIPTVRGCGGSWWEVGAGSFAAEMATNRTVHQNAIAAETICTAATSGAGAAFPADAFERLWQDVLLFDEHTSNAYNSLTEPMSDFVQRHWGEKFAFIHGAARQSERLIASGLEHLARRADAPDGSLLVFNPSGRPRGGMVRGRLPRCRRVMDGDAVVPLQVVRVPEDVSEPVDVALHVDDVPPVGYRTYRVVEDAPASTSQPAVETTSLENDFFRVRFDPATGAIASLLDKRIGAELADQSSPYRLGQLIYALGGEEEKGKTQELCPDPAKVRFVAPVAAKIETGAAGPVFRSVRSAIALEGFTQAEMELRLFDREPRVDFEYRLNKKLTFDKEALYIAFPIAGAHPRFRYEIGGGHVRPNEDQFPGACRDWFAVQRWVTVQTDDATVAWSPLDTPLVTLSDFTVGRWLKDLEIRNGTLFAFAMNNYSCKATQDGPFVFRYSLTSGRTIDPAAAMRFGESVAMPLLAETLATGRTARNLEASKSFLQVEPEDVALTAFKPADDGRGLIVRVRETAGRETTAVIRPAACWRVAKASRCDLVERDQSPLDLHDGQVRVQIAANGMATVRLEPAR